jgi:hypothetical protein
MAARSFAAPSPSLRAAASAGVKCNVMLAMLASLQAVPAAQQAWASMLVGETHAPSSFMPTP